MLNKLIEKIETYKKNIYSFEQNGMILLDKKDANANNIINQIYKDANDIFKIYNKDSNNTELNNFIKDALKKIAFNYTQGVVLIQDEKILIRGDIAKESIPDLMKLIFSDNRSLNRFLYSSISLYLSSIDIKFLSIKELFNIDNIHKRLMSDFIKLLQNDYDIQKKLKDSSINIDELNQDNNKTYLKLNLIVEKILRGSFGKNSGVMLGFMSDFLLRIITTNSTFDLKLIKHFFEKEIIENSDKLNFATIRQNSVAREQYLKSMDISEKKIEKTKDKVNDFLKIEVLEEKKNSELRDILIKNQNDLKEVETLQTNLFNRRNRIGDKSSNDYLSLSSQIKIINAKKVELDIEVKNLNSKYELSKQSLINIEQDRVDYLKLLPELTEVEEKKIDELNKNLKEFENEFLHIKRFIIKVLMIKRPNFDFEQLLQKLKKIKVKKEFCDEIKDKQNANEQRFNGLPLNELEDLKNQIFKDEENLNKFIVIITNQALKRELNFRKISNIEFMNSNVKIIQKYIFLFLNKIIKNTENTLIEGFGNFLLRDKFNLVLAIEAKKLLKFLINKNINAQTFISYFNGEIEEDINGKFKKPELIDKNDNKICITKINSIIRQYRDYLNFLTKRGELIDGFNIKLIKLNSLKKQPTDDEGMIELINKQCEITKQDLEIVKKQRDEFLLAQKDINSEFENLIDVIANVLYKRREKIN